VPASRYKGYILHMGALARAEPPQLRSSSGCTRYILHMGALARAEPPQLRSSSGCTRYILNALLMLRTGRCAMSRRPPAPRGISAKLRAG
jgi:hypothetical protein